MNDRSVALSLDELAHLVSRRVSPAETLSQLVQLIQSSLKTDVCSVYLVEPNRANLMLAATVGLRTDSVGRVRMPIKEGLVGLVVAEATAP